MNRRFSKLVSMTVVTALLITAVFGGISFLPGAGVKVKAATYPDKVGVGVNLEDTIAFVDAMKTAREFWATNGGTLTLDSSGWPMNDAECVIFDQRPHCAWAGVIDDPQKYKQNLTGTYRLSFNGQADLQKVDGNFTIANKVYNTSTNTTTADIVMASDVGGYNDCYMYMKFVNTKRTSGSAFNTGITNVKLIRPGYPANTTQTFTTPFINALAPFKVIRFMDWVHANNSNLPYPQTIDWSQRKLPTDATQQPWGNKKEGGCWEYIIEIANTANKDIWINIPVNATDNYITQLATLIKNTLNTNSRVYIEYNNEVWNWGFTQSTWNNDAAAAEGLSFITRFAKRTVQISNLFRNVFGSTAINNRIRVLLSWQVIANDQFQEQLNYINTNYGAPSQFIYGIASAPYFGDQDGHAESGASTAQLVEDTRTYSENKYWQTGQPLRQLQNTANAWGIKNVAYEGGTWIGNIGSTTNLANIIAAERDPGMKTAIIRNVHDLWFGNGGDLYMDFCLVSKYGRYRCWGLTDDIANVDRNYKYDAFRTIAGYTGGATPTPGPTATAAPTPTPGAGTWTKVDDNHGSVSYTAGWGSWSGNPGYMSTEHFSETTGDIATYTFTGTKARYYGYKRSDLGNAEIYVDDVLKATVDCYNSTDMYNVMLFESAALTYGTHTLKVKVKGTKNASSSGTEIVADAFEYYNGTLATSTPAPTTGPTSTPTPTPGSSGTNIAQGKTASASAQETANPAQNGNDGSTTTRWCSGDPSTGHWWKVDLGSAASITGTEVMWELSGKVYKYKVEVSSDNTNWTLKVDKTNNTSTAQTQRDNFTASNVRYVRITVTGLESNVWASFYEFRVFGTGSATSTPTPAPTSTPTPTPGSSNIAQGKTATASAQESANPAQNGNDGGTTTRWCSGNGGLNHWWRVDLGSAYSITGTEVMWEMSGKVYKYKVETSSNGTTWTTRVDKTNNTSTAQTQRDNFTASNVRYVRITVTGLETNVWASFYEFRVFN